MSCKAAFSLYNKDNSHYALAKIENNFYTQTLFLKKTHLLIECTYKKAHNIRNNQHLDSKRWLLYGEKEKSFTFLIRRTYKRS